MTCLLRLLSSSTPFGTRAMSACHTLDVLDESNSSQVPAVEALCLLQECFNLPAGPRQYADACLCIVLVLAAEVAA